MAASPGRTLVVAALALGCARTPIAGARHDASSRRAGEGVAEGPAFEVRSLDHAPFAAVRVWAPPPGARGRFEAVVLLHGNQPGAGDPTWMLSLRSQPQFERRILVVPALHGRDYAWERPAAARALASLVERVARTFPVDPGATWLVGYSAGASRVLAVAAHMPGRLAGVAAVAGDVLRPLRAPGASLAPFATLPTLLVCMTGDDGPNTSCGLNAANFERLRRGGVRDLALRRLDGDHGLDFGALAPTLDAWMRRAPTR